MGDIGAYKENVKFSSHDAQGLISACNSAALMIEGQVGLRQSWRTTGAEQFKGYFSTLFQTNGATQVKDAGELASGLRHVSTMATALQNSADEEQRRRQKARTWEDQQNHRNGLEIIGDGISRLWGGDEPPVPGPASQLRQSAPKPPTGSRQTPEPGAGGGGSSGTSSAIPDNLTSFASSSSTGDQILSTQLTLVHKAYSAFTSSCGWGSLDASGVVTAFQQFLTANAQEATWANALAAAFEQAGGHGSVCTLSNQALGAALAAGHVSASRQDITIDMPSVLGGVPTSGFADDPVNTATGNFTEPETDLSFTDGCSTLIFGRTYNSAAETDGAFGAGWASWSESGLMLAESDARWILPEGRHIVFPRLGDGWDRAVGASYWLANSEHEFIVSDNSGGTWRFNAEGRLESFERGAGTRVDVMHDADGRFVSLVHERGRSVVVEWAEDRIVRASASDGRRIDYRYDSHGRLTSVTGPTGVRRYVWGDKSGLVEQVIDGDGVVEVLNGYDERGRVAWQKSPFGRISRYSYLPGGITEVADSDGERSNTWVADGSGRLVAVIDSDGYRQSYSWDDHGNMVRATDRIGQKTTREYDDRGRLIHQVTAEGADLQYGYDEHDRAITVVAGAVDDAGADAVTTYEHSGADRNPSMMIDPTGGRTAMVWDRNLLAEIIDPTGVTLRFTYDIHGDLVATTNAVGDIARLERDDAGRVTAAVTPSGHRTTYTFDEVGRPVSRRDPDGGISRFEHTAAGRMSAQVAPDGGRTEIEYGPNGAESRIVDPLGRAATRILDDIGNLATMRLPDGSTWSYAHDAMSRLTESVDPTGGIWSNRFDSDGTLTATVDPTGVTSSLVTNRADNTITVGEGLLATTLRLDALGRPQSIGSVDEDSLTYVYDACGRVLEVLGPEGALTLIRRDASGRLVQVTDPTGVTTGYAYDSCGRLAQVIDPDGAVTTREYDADSLLKRQVLPNGDAAWAKYDACGRLVRVHQPGSGTANYTYDKCGRVTSAVDIWWGTRRFSYDAAGQLTAVTNGLGGVTRYGYDDNGRLIRITDPTGGVTIRSLDGMDRLLSETDALGRATTAKYDAAGRQLWQQGPDGHRLAFSYDASGKVKSTGVDDIVIATNAYDLAHRTVTIDDRTGADPTTHVKQWDSAGRLIRHTRSASDGTGGGLAWEYDRAGRRTSMVDAFGRATRYHYDSAGRLERVDHSSLGTVMLSHDSVGHLTTAETTDPTGQTTHQAWEWEDGVITSHTTTSVSGTATTTIDRDVDGRITAVTRDGVATQYGYDRAEQLTEVVSDGIAQTWTFDINGRLTEQTIAGVQESYEYDPAGQLVSVHHGDGTTTTHEYDVEGARTRTIHPDGTTLDYAWTSSGWLAQLTSTGNEGISATTVLGVDAIGQLAKAGDNSLWWDTAAAVPTLAGIGDTPVLPLGPVTGIAGQWSTSGWRGTRSDTANPWQIEPIVSLRDGFGLTASGTLTVSRGAGTSSLEWLGARAYDPATHGFLATDPLPPVMGAGWASNPYSYAGNNPLAFSDPTGLHPLTDDELRKQTRGWLADAWDATTNWVGNNWQYIVAGVAIVGGIALMCTGVGGPAGIALMAGAGALIAGGADTAIQKFTTGDVDWGQVGVTMVIGAATGGAGAWAAGVSAGANGATALAYSAGINGGIGAAGSEATYLFTNRKDLSWQGAAGALVGGGVAGAISGGAGPAGGTIARNILEDGTRGATSGVTARLITAGINAGGGASGDVVSQAISHPGQPVNWTHAAIAGGAGGATSLASSYASRIPGADHVLPPDPKGMSSLEQASYFGVRTNEGILNFAGRNTQAMLGSAGMGAIVGGLESPGVDKLTDGFN